MDNKKMADLLFPNVKLSVEDVEKTYPRRADGVVVTRFAPSPTGFLHIGGLYGALIDERLAHQNNGVFYLRIEDTDQKREIKGAVDLIIDNFHEFGVQFDEGASKMGDVGAYAPYKQSERADIYAVFAKQLVSGGKAYPCFCSEQDLADNRKAQEEKKVNFGYYGEYAKHRNTPAEEVIERIGNGEKFVLRFKSNGNQSNIIKFVDMVKGVIEMPENDQDIVLLKSDGIPTYHFAHVVDDYLMGTTHVVRGEEWLSTLPWHLQLFEGIGKQPPKYIHTAHVMKLEDGAKRKLSKRKDPEAAVSYYKEQGYPSLAVNEYLMTLLNSNFEDWRKENSSLSYKEFPFSLEKMSVSGALFDMQKLRDISKNIISKMSTDVVVDNILRWAEQYDKQLFYILSSNKQYTKSIFAIGRGGDKPRKDIACFSEVRDYCSFFFPTLFTVNEEFPQNISAKDVSAILSSFNEIYDQNDDNETWFGKIKVISSLLGFCPDMKEYKKNPSEYKGSVADVSSVIRIAITGKKSSPDLYSVMKILGNVECDDRMFKFI